MKKCLKCDTEKEKSEFGSDSYKSDGLNPYCKSCIRIRSCRQRMDNSEYFKNYAKEYRDKNKELLRRKQSVNYYLNWEKRAEDSKRSYEKHRETIAEKRAVKSRTSKQKEKNRLRQRDWGSRNRTRVGEAVSYWKKKNPQKAAAHSLVFYAVRTGVLKRKENCEECGKLCKTEGHHEDYFKPMEVSWLCKICHAKKHQIYR